MGIVVQAQLDNLRKRVARLTEANAELQVEREVLHAECEELKNQLRVLQLRGVDVAPQQIIQP
jgi:16S rRNA G527 N7-methylase RsmG